MLSVVGNRPQFIKSGPVSEALRARGIDEVILHTGQHYDRELSQVFFEELGLPEPRYRLEVGGLERTKMLDALRPGLRRCDRQGGAGLGAGLRRHELDARRRAGRVEAGVPLAHVEAGLRSYDDSMPEEHNRVETDRLSQLLFAPDDRSREILDGEGVPGHVEVVGDVMIDAHQRLAADRAGAVRDPRAAGARAGRLRGRDAAPGGERRGASAGADPARDCRGWTSRSSSRRILGLARLCEGQTPEGSSPNVRLIEPLGYLDFAALASRARVIVTDSGGLQKEAYWYGVPCVTARPSPNGSTRSRPARTCSSTTTPTGSPRRSAPPRCRPTRPQLYGDGHAARRIAAALYPSRPT